MRKLWGEQELSAGLLGRASQLERDTSALRCIMAKTDFHLTPCIRDSANESPLFLFPRESSNLGDYWGEKTNEINSISVPKQIYYQNTASREWKGYSKQGWLLTRYSWHVHSLVTRKQTPVKCTNISSVRPWCFPAPGTDNTPGLASTWSQSCGQASYWD